MSPVTPGEPRESPKPQPIGYFPLVSLVTICTLCALFILWRRASSLRSVVAHRLKAWRGTEGRIRLSEDDGPPARSFVEDEAEDDGSDDEPLANHIQRLRTIPESLRPPPQPTSIP
ncbi:hypothetical protein BD410DRAFT_782895 [Rickenella mellea]|uniref:Uncharacterized protein n=1 Tax=Rickenella mellea TaxID=50990 RepID=A0A4Y7QJ12_9AGAM|nr:hypothetical protein BD410DRAFT_782895 [Rickenella mellea]